VHGFYPGPKASPYEHFLTGTEEEYRIEMIRVSEKVRSLAMPAVHSSTLGLARMERVLNGLKFNCGATLVIVRGSLRKRKE